MSGFGGFRSGLAAVPVYFIAMGAGHIALARHWYDVTTGLARDGQAFSGTFIFGVLFVLIGLVTTPVALAFERDPKSLARGTLAGIAAAAAVVGYTASLGYEVFGSPGELNCIIEQSRQVCPPGDGTWIGDGRPDPVVMTVAAVGAYWLSHLASRLGRRVALATASVLP